MTFSYIVLSDSTLDTLQSFTSIDGWERERKGEGDERRAEPGKGEERRGEKKKGNEERRGRREERREEERSAAEGGKAFTKK